MDLKDKIVILGVEMVNSEMFVNLGNMEIYDEVVVVFIMLGFV